MQIRSLVIAAAVTLSVLPTFALAQSIEIGPGGVRVGRGECEELRRACEYQGVRCGRFREMCGGRSSRRESCRELRWACENRERLGEQGEGNCRRYRQTCRGG